MNNLEGRHSTDMVKITESFHMITFSSSDVWYLLISARCKYLTSVYSSSAEHRRRNRLKSVHSGSKTCSCLISLVAR